MVLIAAFVLYIFSLGYDGTGNEWEGYPRYVNAEGVEMPVSFHSIYYLICILVCVCIVVL